MFDEVTRQKRRKRVRSSAYIAASAAIQALCVLAVVLIADQFRAAATGDAPLVAVRFIRPPPALPAAPPPPAAVSEPQPRPKPRAAPVKRPTTNLVQPKKLSASYAPVPSVDPEPEGPADSEGEDTREGQGGATEGGVVGGVVGGHGQEGAGDGPSFPGAGARKPAEVTHGCVQRSIRIPRDLQGFVSGLILVEFAVRQDGTPSHFRMLTQAVDQRIASAIWQAISSCRWVPGADENGRPEWFRATMPLRFKSG